MTKATRWGVSALMVIGGLALGAFAGCSDDDPTPAPIQDEDSGQPADTMKPDTGTLPDTNMPVDAPPDAPFVADRAVTLAFASPDLAPRWMCMGAFLAADNPADKMAPFNFQPKTGAAGVPDATAPTDFTKTTGFPYGAVVPFPLDEAAQTALGTFRVVVYLLDANPAATGKTCGDMWATVKGDTNKWKMFEPNTVKTGEHGVLAIHGCNTAAGCGAGPFKFTIHKVSMAKPTESGADIGFQFLHLSQFDNTMVPNPLDAGPATVTVPGFQSTDIYVVPGPDTADAGAGAFIKIAENVKYDDAVTALKGFNLPDGTKNDASRLVVATRIPTDGGTVSYPCANPIPTGQAGAPPSTTCPNWTFYLKPFFDQGKYALLGGGLEYPNTNQLVILAGNPISATPPPPLRIMFARAGKW